MSATYSSSYYAMIDRVQASHFWFQARNHMLASLINRFLPLNSKATFLEVGCGTGLVLRLLSQMGFMVTGIDVNRKAILHAKSKSTARLIERSIYSFKTKERYDAIGAFDVLEHQTDDIQFLKICQRLLVPGGYFFLTVPAGRWLWSQVDKDSGHKRRYESDGLIQIIRNSGFEVIYWNYWNTLPLPVYMIWRNLVATRHSSTLIENYLKLPNKLVNFLLYALMRIEQTASFSMTYPCGASLVLCAKKTKN